MLATSKSIFGFDPRSVPGCQLWLDGADVNSMTLSSSSVTQWSDKSGMGRHYTTYGNSPTYSSADGGSVTFSAGQALTNADTWSGNGGGVDLFIVTTPWSYTKYGDWRTLFRGNAGHRVILLNNGTALGYYANNTNGWNQYGSLTVGNAKTLIYTTTNTSFVSSAALNGNPTLSVAPGVQDSDAYPFRYLGAYQGGPSQDWGTINEVLIFSNVTTAQRQAIEGYLAWKWGIESIPQAHLVPGCIVWTDSSQGSSQNIITTSGYSVTSTGQVKLNGKNGLSTTTFNTSQSWTVSPAPSLSTYTMFWVGRQTGGTNGRVLEGQAYNMLYGYWGGYKKNLHLSYWLVAPDGGYSSDTAWDMFSHSRTASGPYTFNWNGTSAGSGSSSTSNPMYGLSINAGEASGEKSDCEVAEILLYDRVLLSGQIQHVEGYLSNKWKLNELLPVAHPSYFIKPFARRFDPNDIAGLKIWLDGADNTTMIPANPSSGTTISAWLDKASQYSFTPGAIQTQASNGTVYTVDGPTYYAGGGLQFSNPSGQLGNGQQGLGIWGTNLNSFPLYTLPTQAMTMVVASYPFLNNGYRQIAWTGSYQLGGSTLPNFLLGLEMGVSEGGNLLYDYNGSTWPQNNYTPDAHSGYYNWNTVPRVDILVSAPGANQWWWTNGTLNTFQYSNIYTSTYSNYPVSFFFLGSYTNTIQGNRNFHGIIYEVMFYSNALTTSQRQQVEGYLARKWGFASSLPSNHPFYSIPPSTALPFSPTNITGCALWLDAADTSSMVLSGSNVTLWKDKSGNSYDAVSQTTPATLVASSFGGNTSLLFSGTSKYYCPASTISNIGYTIFTVQNLTNGSGYRRVINSQLTAFVGALDGYVATFTGTGGSWNDVASNLPAFNSLNKNTLVSMEVLNKTLTPYVNGGVCGTKVGTTGSFSNFYIGADYAETQFWYGNISEIIMYNGILSASQRQQVEGYLAWKWDIVGRLLPFPAAGYTSLTTGSGWIAYRFTSNGGTITVQRGRTLTVDYLLVGGGGGASGYIGGGGGGGYYVYTTSASFTPGTYIINIGSGGIGQISANAPNATSGGSTTIVLNGSTVATGPGGGGAATIGGLAGSSGSFTGGSYNGGTINSGGGAGAGGNGANGGTYGGDGGIGVQNSITGTATYYGGGGGGGWYTGNVPGTGGAGGGANGASSYNPSSSNSGTDGLGGGGGGSTGGGASRGGNGGSGVAIIRIYS